MSKATPVRMEKVTVDIRIELTRDTNGNWFASFERHGSFFCTGTWTEPAEAIEEAIQRGKQHGLLQR